MSNLLRPVAINEVLRVIHGGRSPCLSRYALSLTMKRYGLYTVQDNFLRHDANNHGSDSGYTRWQMDILDWPQSLMSFLCSKSDNLPKTLLGVVLGLI